MTGRQLSRCRRTFTCSTFWAIRVLAVSHHLMLRCLLTSASGWAMENLNAINEKIVSLKTRPEPKKDGSEPPSGPQNSISGEPENMGRIDLFEVTACPQENELSNTCILDAFALQMAFCYSKNYLNCYLFFSVFYGFLSILPSEITSINNDKRRIPSHFYGIQLFR